MSEKEIVNDLIMISKYLNKNIKGDIKEILKCALEKVENSNKRRIIEYTVSADIDNYKKLINNEINKLNQTENIFQTSLIKKQYEISTYSQKENPCISYQKITNDKELKKIISTIILSVISTKEIYKEKQKNITQTLESITNASEYYDNENTLNYKLIKELYEFIKNNFNNEFKIKLDSAAKDKEILKRKNERLGILEELDENIEALYNELLINYYRKKLNKEINEIYDIKKIRKIICKNKNQNITKKDIEDTIDERKKCKKLKKEIWRLENVIYYNNIIESLEKRTIYLDEQQGKNFKKYLKETYKILNITAYLKEIVEGKVKYENNEFQSSNLDNEIIKIKHEIKKEIEIINKELSEIALKYIDSGYITKKIDRFLLGTDEKKDNVTNNFLNTNQTNKENVKLIDGFQQYPNIIQIPDGTLKKPGMNHELKLPNFTQNSNIKKPLEKSLGYRPYRKELKK